jgi:trans-2,3-dihydro-3-hydroxyanthranilate isomerase
MPRRYVIADVFSDTAFGGNPLAVYLDGDGLDTRQMQAIAREMNLSETTFVTPGGADGRFRVRIFTPARELPFAGHPTIGTAVVLAETGAAAGRAEIVLEEGVGPVRVALRPGAATFSLDGAAERRAAGASNDVVATALGLAGHDLAGEPWQAGYGGVAYLYVRLVDRAAVGRSWLAAEKFAALGLWGHGVYAFAVTDDSSGHVTLHARAFVPASGVPEDPATGSAAAGLAGSISVAPVNGVFRLRITQGVEMGRPSLIETETRTAGGTVAGVLVGGGAVLVADGVLRRDP